MKTLLLKEDGIAGSNAPHSQIFTTKDFSIFKKLTGNRDIAESNVTNKMNEIKANIKEGKSPLFSPIIINEKYQIIDGQHRIEAMKRLQNDGVSVYVEYIIRPGFELKDTQAMQKGKSWMPADYLKSHCAAGNKDYIKYSIFSKKWSHVMTHQTILMIFGKQSTSSKVGANHAQFNEGKFCMDMNDEQADKWAQYLSDFDNIGITVRLTAPQKRAFQTVMARFFRYTDPIKSISYDHKRMLRKLDSPMTANKMWSCQKPDEFQKMIVECYNKQSGVKERSGNINSGLLK